MAEKKKKKGLLMGLIAVLAAAAALLAVWQPWKTGGANEPAAVRAAATPMPERENAVTGEAFFPEGKDWTYHFVYAYPHFEGDGYAVAAVNDTYQTALEEMLRLVLPMFANEEAMRYDGSNEIMHDFEICCNNGRFLSILQKRSQTRGNLPDILTMEAQTFDMAGEYLGETLTLRGVVMVGDSSDQLGQALYPVLYDEFVRLQKEGVCDPALEREDFELEFDPTRDFYTDENGNAVFFFPPGLLVQPSFDVPVFVWSPADLEALLTKE